MRGEEGGRGVVVRGGRERCSGEGEGGGRGVVVRGRGKGEV